MLPNDNMDEVFYQLALTFVANIGPKSVRPLLEHFGTARDVFKAPLKEIKNISGIGEARAKAFKEDVIWTKAEKELAFVTKHDVQVLFYGTDNYPQKLSNCSDAPLLLYYKGNANLNSAKTVAIVGTRKNTEYGTKLTEDLIIGLQSQEDMLIASGLAAGIDSIAHKKAVALGIPTVGALGHGLDMIYPASNRQLAKDMVLNGGLLTEFRSETIPDKGNFPMRNRIVAGISDVTVVVESSKSGGALITAQMANSYNREVAAFPGRVNDSRSAGCNELIRNNVAAMITDAEDLLNLMNWNTGKKQKTVQRDLFINLTPEEQAVIDVLKTKDALHIDELLHQTQLSMSHLAATLLGLEMQGIIKTMPGKYYRIS